MHAQSFNCVWLLATHGLSYIELWALSSQASSVGLGEEPSRLLCPWDSPGKNIGEVAISSSRGSSWPRDRTWVSCISCTGMRFFFFFFFYHWATWEAPLTALESNFSATNTITLLDSYHNLFFAVSASILAPSFAFSTWPPEGLTLKHKVLLWLPLPQN